MNNNQKGILFACTTALFWGFLAIFLKIAVQKVEPQTIVWFRFTTAFTVLLIWHLIEKPSELKILAKPPFWLLIAAIGLAWNYFGFMQAVNYTSPSNAQLIAQLGPVLLTIAGLLFFNEKLRRIQIVGFILAAIGFGIFYSQQLQQMLDQKNTYNIGVLFAISAAVSWVAYAVMQKKLVIKYSTDTLNLFLFGFPAVAYLPFVNFNNFSGLSLGWWILLIFLGLNTLIAYGSLSLALKYTQANKVSIILLLNPTITFVTMAILTSMEVSWIEGERFTAFSLLGAFTILLGAVFVVKQKSKWKKPEAEIK
ncbi:DMT family transporter [Mangrovibacterium marinum]|uniref:RarD protein n=1 Tax=Mangrovibacterium marinum TaxID=1639118 RepID=A0A2T5C5F5_9BACT|nr:DMT family transporter [Mangrovibacterium marinum]PTN10144.1 RarD protein [Mangrovibacterium marinum]